jgi:hypothetical protein
MQVSSINGRYPLTTTSVVVLSTFDDSWTSLEFCWGPTSNLVNVEWKVDWKVDDNSLPSSSFAFTKLLSILLKPSLFNFELTCFDDYVLDCIISFQLQLWCKLTPTRPLHCQDHKWWDLAISIAMPYCTKFCWWYKDMFGLRDTSWNVFMVACWGIL